MSKSNRVSETDRTHLQLALCTLHKKFHSPGDLLKYWSLTGPCQESHPEIEDYVWEED